MKEKNMKEKSGETSGKEMLSKKEVEENKSEDKPNKMREIKIEKVVLSVSGVEEELEKGAKLLERLSGKKSMKRKSKRRIPSLGVRPGLQVGAMVTLRGEKANEILKRLFATIENKIRKKQINNNFFSFGIKEYIEIPGMDYQRDLGILGFDVTVCFARAGKRIARKKIKRGKLPEKQKVKVNDIIRFIKDKFNVEVA